MGLYERIKEACRIRNTSINKLEQTLGFTRSSISKFNTNVPSVEKIQQISKELDIPTDFIVGNTNYITCNVCHNTYNPLNKVDSDEHEILHKKFLEAEKKFGKILIYEEAFSGRNLSISNCRNPSKSETERIMYFEDYLKYDYMIQIWHNHFDLNFEDFETYCKKEMGLSDTKSVLDEISSNAYQILADKYGVADDSQYHEPIALTDKDQKDIKNIIENTEQLLKQQGLMFDGKPASQEAIDSVLSAMQIGMEMAKKKNKELYTPKKYKKEK